VYHNDSKFREIYKSIFQVLVIWHTIFKDQINKVNSFNWLYTSYWLWFDHGFFTFITSKHLHKCVLHLSSPDIASFPASIHSPDKDCQCHTSMAPLPTSIHSPDKFTCTSHTKCSLFNFLFVYIILTLFYFLCINFSYANKVWRKRGDTRVSLIF
jgi:hypothetical protein